MNITIVSGRLTKDPEIMTGSTGMATCRATLAVNYFEKGESKAYFIPLLAFDKNATNLCTYAHKGTYLNVIGRLSTNTYTKTDGTKGYSWQVIIDRFEMLNDGIPKIKEEEKISGVNESIPNITVDTNDDFSDFTDPFKNIRGANNSNNNNNNNNVSNNGGNSALFVGSKLPWEK